MSAPPSNSGPTVERSLGLRWSAIRGFAFGAAVAAAVLVFFVILPGTTRPVGLYAGLAVVLGVSVGGLATAVLVAWRAHRMAREL